MSVLMAALAQAAAMTALRPNLSAKERLSELAEILAAGFIRLQGSKSSGKSVHTGECLLDFNRHQSGHPHPSTGGEMDA
jgi:hypothetical protein